MILGDLDPDVCLDCGRHPSRCDCAGAELSPVEVEGNDEDEVRAACGGCGWRGPWRESIRHALDEADAHQADECGRVADGSPAPGMCLRWQEPVAPTTGRLRFSCGCGGVGCPFDPRPRRG